MQTTKNDKLIEQLKEQVKKAEAKGLTDTAHHTMLNQILKQQPVEGVTPRNTAKGEQEK